MNETNFDNDMRADDLFIEADLRDEIQLTDAEPNDVPVWIENEDGSGQWSDGWGLADRRDPDWLENKLDSIMMEQEYHRFQFNNQ